MSEQIECPKHGTMYGYCSECVLEGEPSPERERQLLDALRAVQASYNKGWNDAIEAARLAYGAHYHKAHYENGVRTDACGVCGEAFRAPIHLRTGETVLNRIDALAGEGKCQPN